MKAVIIIIGIITMLSCSSTEPDAKSIAKKQIIGSWDWQKTNYVDTGVIKTAADLGYVRKVVLNGHSWIQYRDNVKDHQLEYSIEYSKDPTNDHKHLDYELVLSHSDGHWDLEIKND